MTHYLTIRHEARDYATWKLFYDADAPNRAAAGLTDLLCVRGAENPNLIGLIFEVADVAKARAMAGSDALRETMDKAGIFGQVFAAFRHGRFTPQASANYMSAYFKVSGIDTFLTGYAMDAADRHAAGITEMAIMQNADDANDVFLLWAVADVGRVKAFMSSPELADHQVKNAGLVSTPEARFWTAT